MCAACAGLQSNALLYAFPTAVQLLARVKSTEAAVAAALGIPAAPEAEPSADVEKAEGGSTSTTTSPVAAAAAAPAGGPPAKARRPLAQLAATAGPYVAGLMPLLLVASPLVTWKTIYTSVSAALRELPASLASKAALAKGAAGLAPPHLHCDACALLCLPASLPAGGCPHQRQPAPTHCPPTAAALRDPVNQYFLKLWFGLCVAIFASVMVVWQVGGCPGLSRLRVPMCRQGGRLWLRPGWCLLACQSLPCVPEAAAGDLAE